GAARLRALHWRFHDGPAATAYLGAHPLFLSHHAFSKSLIRIDLARRHGSGARVVRGFLALPDSNARALWSTRNAHCSGVLCALPPASSAYAALGGAAANARSHDSAPFDGSPHR